MHVKYWINSLNIKTKSLPCMKNIFVNQKSFDEKSGIILHFCKTLYCLAK